MDEKYRNEPFVTLRIKESVAKDFRKFCKDRSQSQTMTLERMLFFFKQNDLEPDDEISTDLRKLERKMLKRINAVISIIKNIERTQTIPTLAILQSLLEGFGAEEKRKKPLLIEKKRQSNTLEDGIRRWKEKNMD